MFENLFEGYGLKAFGSILVGVPIAVVVNAVVSVIINRLLRLQKKPPYAVLMPSLLSALTLSGILALSFVFIEYREANLRSAAYYFSGFVGFYVIFFLMITVPQLLTHAILRRKATKLRPVLSAVFGCAIVLSYAYVLWTVGRMIGATPD